MAPSFPTLEKKCIKIEENPRNITRLPTYAEGLRQLLLNFKGILPGDVKFRLKQEDDTIYCESYHKKYKDGWDAALKSRYKAIELLDRNNESTWNGFMSNFIFGDINDQASDQGIHLRDLLSWGSDQLFTNTAAIRGPFSDKKPHAPKPDFWFGLGLYNEQQLSRLQGLERSDKGIDHFTQKNLEDMSTNHTKSLAYKPVKSRENAAFPWMVVELKKEKGDENECLRQAANASHACLMLCKRLAAPTKLDTSPIVALTAIGPVVKIFIAYMCENDDKHDICRMSCIWSGNVGNIWHAVQLRRIVDQLMYWALRIFKPWVTECLDHWYNEEVEQESEEEDEEETDEEQDQEETEEEEDE
ncbi:MAG: hypothetical protein Q9191_001577 [Dirinaria sp. TL-2023a]